MKHSQGAGALSTSTTDDNSKQAQQMILADRRITVDELAYSLEISHNSAHQIIHNDFGFRKVSAMWVPRELMADHKQRHL